MNKNLKLLGSLCIFIIVLLILLYFTKSIENFVDTPLATATSSLTKAKQSIADTNTALTAATKAVGTPSEIGAAKDAFSKANTAVADANAAVNDTKTALGEVNPKSLSDIADVAKKNWTDAQKVVTDKDAPGSDYNKAKADVDPNNPNSAVAKANAAKAKYDALPN